jgi:hypothetical protein
MVELMVALAILAILVGLSITAFKSSPSQSDSYKVSSWINEARRRAVTKGPVRADVAAALGLTYRTRIEYGVDVTGSSYVSCWELEEDPTIATGTWSYLGGVYLTGSIYAVTNVAHADSLGTTPPGIGTTPVYEDFFADGTSGPATVYLQPKFAPQTSQQYRVVVYPLMGAPVIVEGW